MSAQTTDGVSISYDIEGASYLSGRYQTVTTSIDGYGTVRSSQTAGVSGRDINTGDNRY